MSMKRDTCGYWNFNASEPTAAARARRAFSAYLHEHCTDDSDFVAAEMVFAELISNAFRHGRAPVRIWVDCDMPNCILSVQDRGPGFEARPAQLPADVLSENGRGLFLVNALARRVEIVSRPHCGSVVKALLPVSFAA
ncbi:MAG: ATP-binding protein [Candidatus Baltobacteraceae bacterium]